MKCEVPPISISIFMLSAIGVENFFAAAVFINKQNVVKVFFEKSRARQLKQSFCCCFN
jgi:hypothetical protein